MSADADEIRLIATLVAKPGQERALRDQLERLLPLVQPEPGCIQYTLHAVTDRPGTFVFYEVWKDAASLDAHGRTPHFQAFATALPPLLAEPLTITKMKLI